MQKCLACGSKIQDILFRIPNLPLVDSFSKSIAEARQVPSYTIELGQCVDCSTIQLVSPPDTSLIFKNYIYESSSSPDLDRHFEEYADSVSKLDLKKSSNILEIGANDGLLLKKIKKRGYNNLVAVDPAPQVHAIEDDDILVINDFFNRHVSEKLLDDKGCFDLIVANNCFSHIPNLSDVLNQCRHLLSKTGSILIEVQSTADLLEKVVFDYIYHEHYFYHTLTSFSKLADMANLQVYNVTKFPTKGGSFRFFLGHKGKHKQDKSVDYFKFRESILNIHERIPWERLDLYLERLKVSLKEYLDGVENIFGYGASATGTVLTHFMGLESKIKYVIDDNKKRQGTFSPSTCVPVYGRDRINSADVCIILAWRHAKLIEPFLNEKNIKYIVPLPFLKTND